MKDLIHVLVAGADSAFLPKTLDVQDVIPMNIELAVIIAAHRADSSLFVAFVANFTQRLELLWRTKH